MQRRSIRSALVTVMLLTAVAATAAPAAAAPAADRTAAQTAGLSAAAAAPYCGITWGSLPKYAQINKHTTATIDNLRAGRHECFDRLVIDLGPKQMSGAGQALGYQVRYVKKVTGIASGETVKIAGGAFLSISLNAAAYDLDYKPTYSPKTPLKAVNVAGFSTFRQVAFLGSFEGQSLVAIGVRAKLPMRVQVLAGPGKGSRLVVDVAHKW
jgi:hypothetical protein